MSNKKHKSTNYSNPEPNETVVEKTVEMDEVVEEPVAPKKEILGVVTECVILNVRKEPNADAEIVTKILLGTEVMVDETESTEDFYKICTGSGAEGYCMKQFINTNS